MGLHPCTPVGRILGTAGQLRWNLICEQRVTLTSYACYTSYGWGWGTYICTCKLAYLFLYLGSRWTPWMTPGLGNSCFGAISKRKRTDVLKKAEQLHLGICRYHLLMTCVKRLDNGSNNTPFFNMIRLEDPVYGQLIPTWNTYKLLW